MLFHDHIFDLYGTLVDILTDESLPAVWENTAAFYSAHGADYGAEELRSAYMELCARKQAEEADPLYEFELREVFGELFSDKGVSAGAELIGEAAILFRRESTLKLAVYPWVEPVFRSIREAGGRIFLLSNAQACFTLPELEQTGLAGAFDGMAISSDTGRKKPHPRIMESLIEAYGTDPRSAVMIGNDRRTDIAIARAFSMHSLYIRTETSDPGVSEPRADFEITDGDTSKIYGYLRLY